MMAKVVSQLAAQDDSRVN